MKRIMVFVFFTGFFFSVNNAFSFTKFDFKIDNTPHVSDIEIINNRPALKEIPRLNGQGRPNTSLLKMVTENGYCLSDNGVKSALSYQVSNWYNSPAVCPMDTWVCRKRDVSKRPCQTEDNSGHLLWITCDGTYQSMQNHIEDIPGWLADSMPQQPQEGALQSTIEGFFGKSTMCNSFPVWCCWK